MHAHLLVAPLRAVVVEEAGAVHLAWRTAPVQTKGQGQPAGLRPQFFLAHVVCPAAAGLTHAAAHQQHVDQAAVVHVHVVPVVHRRADDDHRAPFGLVGIVGELAGHLDDLLAADAGNLLLPCRSARYAGIVIAAGYIGAAQTAIDSQTGGLDVKYRRYAQLLTVGHGQHAAGQMAVLDLFAVGLLEVIMQLAAEVRKGDIDDFAGVDLAQLQRHITPFSTLAGFDIPFAGLAPAVADRAQRRDQLIGGFIDGDGFPFRVVVLAQLVVQIRGAQEAGRLEAMLRFLEQHQHRKIGITAHVIGEVRARILQVEFLEDHMIERLRQSRVGALLGVQPEIGQLGDLGIVRGDGHRLGALVADFGEEMRIGRAGLRNVGAPGNDVVGVVPVGRFRHVGLFAPDHG